MPKPDFSYIETYTGELVSLVNPTSDTIRFDDIAHALANLCRFNGHTGWFYSVAEHSILTARIAGKLAEAHDYEATAAHALLHDAHEAYLGDISTPMKKAISFPQEMADRFDVVISDALRVDLSTRKSIVKQADAMALVIEADALFSRFDPEEWGLPSRHSIPRDYFKLFRHCFGSPVSAEQRFIDVCRYHGVAHV